MTIHLCDRTDESTFVSVRIACDQTWTDANISLDGDDDRHVFTTTDGRAFAFMRNLITCRECRGHLP